MFVLAHISDPHLAPLPTPRFSELASKRLLGFLNWQRKRRNIHCIEPLEALLADVRAHAPDHIAITGDLINLAQPDEFRAARLWLGQVGAPQDVTLVPGNHDAYVRKMAREAVARWGEYMTGEALPADARNPFPFVRRRGPLALIGVSSAVATAPFMATGRVGSAQLAQMSDLLERLGAEGLFRIVLIHHPPIEEVRNWWERLVDVRPFLAALAKTGAEMVIHGHHHVHSVYWLDGPGQRIPAVGVPSASAAPGGRWEAAGYNLYRIDGGPGAWQCEVISRGYGKSKVGIGEISRRVLVRG